MLRVPRFLSRSGSALPGCCRSSSKNHTSHIDPFFPAVLQDLRQFVHGVFVYHPGSAPVWPPHSGRDHVLVLSAVHYYQLHTIGLAPSFVHGGNSVMALQWGGGSFARAHPVII